MRIVLTTDTHVPKRARDLPAPLWSAIDAADLVVHAGDWVDLDTLDAFTARSATLLACYGNNDGPALRARLPEIAYATVAGLRIAVVHETGPSTGRDDRCAARFPDVDLLVFGHSHIPWDSTARSGLRLLNPGSPTDRRRQPAATFMTATISTATSTAATSTAADISATAGLTADIAAAALTDVTLHRIQPRSTWG